MRVLFDHAIFARQPFGGISRYFSELISRLCRDPAISVNLFMGLHINEYGVEAARGGMANFFGVRRPIKRRTYRITKHLNQWLFERFAAKVPADIYHATSYQQFARGFHGARVVTCHDMTMARLPEYFRDLADQRIEQARSLRAADGVICISENTRRDAIEIVGIPAEKTRVIYHGGGLVMPEHSPAPFEFPYVLFVGSRGAYKNFSTLLHAFARTPRLRSDLHLVCFGGGQLTPAERDSVTKLGVADKVRTVAGSDALLAALYAHAAVFVYPSLYEGFGIPLLESMSCGCPVLCSRASCFPEIAADAAMYFEALSADDLAHQLLRLLDDSGLRESMIRAGKDRQAMFSWDRAAQETSDFYRWLVAR